MQKAEEDSILAMEQYGSRKHHDAATAALNKKLTFDYLRIMKKLGVLISNDASKYYDRIVHSVAILSMLCTGIEYNTIRLLFLPIQRMVHKIATGYDISSCSYAADASIPPLQGILQGNGNGPSGWALISSPLFDMLRDIGFGAEIIAVLSQEISFLAGFGFVDDVDLVVTGDSSNVMQKAQEGLTIW